jgi:four helix bundle protein
MNLYRDLEIWKDSISLIKEIYQIAENLPKSEEYNLKQQLKRAVISVSLNIAEGKQRKTAKDFSQFLAISSGSLVEMDAILFICSELGFIKEDISVNNKIEILGKRINALRSKLRG